MSDLCRSITFTKPREGYSLYGHVIKNLTTTTASSCKNLCTMESQCVSVNISPPLNGKVVCELSDSDHVQHPADLKLREGYIYRATQVSRISLDDITCELSWSYHPFIGIFPVLCNCCCCNYCFCFYIFGCFRDNRFCS